MYVRSALLSAISLATAILMFLRKETIILTMMKAKENHYC
jgi:hypothetical protein